MGYRTDADNAIDKAKEATQTAFLELGGIVMETTNGADEYSKVYREKIKEAFDKLREVRGLLRNE